ncbi:MAG: mandelate racemase/muconate lactonizing enzyme family protein [Verrucomicrobiae bacterium]|nr:mandelate racemase/muconate lactonizing enzyme family protein [Verrucomicrobiae bacterium]
MKITRLDFIPLSIPYTHREESSQVNRDGVSDILVRAETDDGCVGWGESCSGANLESIHEALKAMRPFVLGRSPWESEAIRQDLWRHGLWLFRRQTGAFAFAGIDMALWDLCGKESGQPLYNLFGGRVRESVDYFYYLSRGTPAEVARQTREAVARGFRVLYLKVGIGIEAELEMVAAIREAGGPGVKIRVDANGAWTVAEAIRNITALDRYSLDFVEQPVSQDPVTNMQEVRARVPVALSANEGLWSVDDAYRQITARTADVFCFSPYWVGTMALFRQLALTAHCEGLRICKHTHGEFGIAATAAQHLLLTLPNLVEGQQQTAHVMQDDLLKAPVPIMDQPTWGVPAGSGLGIEVDEDKIARYHEAYQKHGQFLPYDPSILGRQA